MGKGAASLHQQMKVAIKKGQGFYPVYRPSNCSVANAYAYPQLHRPIFTVSPSPPVAGR